MGVPQNGWFKTVNPIKKDDDWGSPYDSGNIQVLVNQWKMVIPPFFAIPTSAIRQQWEL